MPITVTDDQGNTQEICPAACYDGLFDPDNMTQVQIDAICNLFQCGPTDVDALATALYLICQQMDGGGTSDADDMYCAGGVLPVWATGTVEVFLSTGLSVNLAAGDMIPQSTKGCVYVNEQSGRMLYIPSINEGNSGIDAYTEWEPSVAVNVPQLTGMPLIMSQKYGNLNYFSNIGDDYYTVPEDGYYFFGACCGYTGNVNTSAGAKIREVNIGVSFGVTFKTLAQLEFRQYYLAEGAIEGRYFSYLNQGNQVRFSVFFDKQGSCQYPIRDNTGRGGAQTWITKSNFEAL